MSIGGHAKTEIHVNGIMAVEQADEMNGKEIDPAKITAVKTIEAVTEAMIAREVRIMAVVVVEAAIEVVVANAIEEIARIQ